MATTKRPRTTKSKKTATPATAEIAKVTTQAVDITDEIRYRAYELYEQRGRQHGRDLDDWVRAEGEVMARFGAHTA